MTDGGCPVGKMAPVALKAVQCSLACKRSHPAGSLGIPARYTAQMPQAHLPSLRIVAAAKQHSYIAWRGGRQQQRQVRRLRQGASTGMNYQAGN